jgi:hypothetical protein
MGAHGGVPEGQPEIGSDCHFSTKGRACRPALLFAFNNDTRPARYNKAAAELAWQRTVAHLKKHIVQAGADRTKDGPHQREGPPVGRASIPLPGDGGQPASALRAIRRFALAASGSNLAIGVALR